MFEICNCDECECINELDYLEAQVGICTDCEQGFHDEYNETLENSGWGSWDDGGLR